MSGRQKGRLSNDLNPPVPSKHITDKVKLSPNVPQGAHRVHSLETWGRLFKTIKGLMWRPPCWILLMLAA